MAMRNMDDYISFGEAAKELGMERTRFSRWVRRRGLRVYADPVDGRVRMLRKEELRAALRPGLVRMQVGEGMSTKELSAHPERTVEEAIARARALQARILERRGGVPLPDSSELIREMREERINRILGHE